MKSSGSMKTRFNWNFWLGSILFLLFLILEKEIFNTYYTAILYGLILILTGIIYSYRYRMHQPALILCFAGITLWHYIVAARYDALIDMVRLTGINSSSLPAVSPSLILIWMINLLILMIMIPVFGTAAIKAFQLERSARKIFSLAATNVHSAENGMTSRPYHAGTMGFTEEQVTGFSRYVAGKMIAYPVYHEKGIRFEFSMKKSPLSTKKKPDVSYVQFDYTQNIDIYISPDDYKRFKSQLTFDQLCKSMGDLFRRFLLYYINNQENRILSELKSI